MSSGTLELAASRTRDTWSRHKRNEMGRMFLRIVLSG